MQTEKIIDLAPGFGDLTHDRLRTIFTDACVVKVEDDGLKPTLLCG